MHRDKATLDSTESQPFWRPGSEHEGQNFTIVPPGAHPPLPATELLGAVDLRERADLSETLLQHFVTKPKRDLFLKHLFIGFEGDGGKEYDPSDRMLRRIRKLKLAIEPVSMFKESSMHNGERELRAGKAHDELLHFLHFASG
jgi:hypothetical protein